MEQKFIQAGKMATLGEMATGVAHELNQPLTVIKGAASYFLRKTRRSEPIAPETLSELSVEISGQVDRASDIINHMRAFGRKSDLALLDTDINGVVAQACEFLFGRQLVVHGITLETSLAPALPPVLAIPNRLGTGHRQPHPQRPGRRGGTRQKRARTARRHRRLHGYGRQHGAAVRLGYRDRRSRPPAE